MRPLYAAQIIQIEVTNRCVNQCSNCTRCVGHHTHPFIMDLSFVEKAVDSLDGFKNTVGIMGGEPTLHPQFTEICEILQRKVPTYRTGLWTSGYKWDQYKSIITKTFGEVLYNDHSDESQKHQPILIAIDEVVQDKELMWRLIDQCWIQMAWSPSITPKGGFFCEVAAALDWLFQGPGGYPIEPGWWKRDPCDFQDQVKRYCPMCSGALPFVRFRNQGEKDVVSKGNLERLLAVQSPKAIRGDVIVYDRSVTAEDVHKQEKDWKPWQYLGSLFKRKKNLKIDELWLLIGFHGLRKRYLKLKWMLTHGFRT